ncbi:MAG: hypothetical protein KAS32_23725 [Candidatus Peribacteraceae bacterium]|nr:hypothetical protein [Candidatus Peribacteraceae bacterium]
MDKPINTYDLDGVIFMGDGRVGIRPSPSDVIITGRSSEERTETENFLAHNHMAASRLIMNPIPFDYKTREMSGRHKVVALSLLQKEGYDIVFHYEDDPIQAKIIEDAELGVHVILLVHDLVEKENVRHT